MKRKIIDKLIQWKSSSSNNCLFLLGASGVGKSYLACNFAKSFYQNMIYLDLSIKDEITKEWLEEQITFKQDLLENQEVANLLVVDNLRWNIHGKSIKEFLDGQKNSKVCDILMISSYWVPSYGKGLKVAYLTLYPLDFEEFLLATGNAWYIDAIKSHYITSKKLPDIVHNELMDLFYTFLTVGGMPLAVNEYITNEGTYNVRRQHKLLYQSILYQLQHSQLEYKNLDISKVENVFKIIPAQLLKENQKFKFTLIKKGATINKYLAGIQFLHYGYYSFLCSRIDGEAIKKEAPLIWDKPLKNGFKLYQSDVGILHTALWELLPEAERHLNNNLAKKALFDNHVAITLSSKGYSLFYWESNSQAKMDFVLVKNKEFIPIEVKPSNYTRSKVFSIFKEQYPETQELIKLSTRNFGSSNQVKFVPIYATFCI